MPPFQTEEDILGTCRDASPLAGERQLAHLTNQTQYERIDMIRRAFVRFVDEAEQRAPGTFERWPDAWAVYLNSTFYPRLQ